jgi:hypothetical protein
MRGASQPRPISDFLSPREAAPALQLAGLYHPRPRGRLRQLEHLRKTSPSRSRIGLTAELPLPRAKSRYRRDMRHYSQVLEPRQRSSAGVRAQLAHSVSREAHPR